MLQLNEDATSGKIPETPQQKPPEVNKNEDYGIRHNVAQEALNSLSPEESKNLLAVNNPTSSVSKIVRVANEPEAKVTIQKVDNQVVATVDSKESSASRETQSLNVASAMAAIEERRAERVGPDLPSGYHAPVNLNPVDLANVSKIAPYAQLNKDGKTLTLTVSSKDGIPDAIKAVANSSGTQLAFERDNSAGGKEFIGEAISKAYGQGKLADVENSIEKTGVFDIPIFGGAARLGAKSFDWTANNPIQGIYGGIVKSGLGTAQTVKEKTGGEAVDISYGDYAQYLATKQAMEEVKIPGENGEETNLWELTQKKQGQLTLDLSKSSDLQTLRAITGTQLPVGIKNNLGLTGGANVLGNLLFGSVKSLNRAKTAREEIEERSGIKNYQDGSIYNIVDKDTKKEDFEKMIQKADVTGDFSTLQKVVKSFGIYDPASVPEYSPDIPPSFSLAGALTYDQLKKDYPQVAGQFTKEEYDSVKNTMNGLDNYKKGVDQSFAGKYFEDSANSARLNLIGDIVGLGVGDKIFRFGGKIVGEKLFARSVDSLLGKSAEELATKQLGKTADSALLKTTAEGIRREQEVLARELAQQGALTIKTSAAKSADEIAEAVLRGEKFSVKIPQTVDRASLGEVVNRTKENISSILNFESPTVVAGNEIVPKDVLPIAGTKLPELSVAKKVLADGINEGKIIEAASTAEQVKLPTAKEQGWNLLERVTGQPKKLESELTSAPQIFYKDAAANDVLPFLDANTLKNIKTFNSAHPDLPIVVRTTRPGYIAEVKGVGEAVVITEDRAIIDVNGKVLRPEAKWHGFTPEDRSIEAIVLDVDLNGGHVPRDVTVYHEYGHITMGHKTWGGKNRVDAEVEKIFTATETNLPPRDAYKIYEELEAEIAGISEARKLGVDISTTPKLETFLGRWKSREDIIKIDPGTKTDLEKKLADSGVNSGTKVMTGTNVNNSPAVPAYLYTNDKLQPLKAYYHYTNTERADQIAASKTFKITRPSGAEQFQAAIDRFKSDKDLLQLIDSALHTNNLEGAGIYVTDLPPNKVSPGSSNFLQALADAPLKLLRLSTNIGVPEENLQRYFIIYADPNNPLVKSGLQTTIMGIREWKVGLKTLPINDPQFVIEGPFTRFPNEGLFQKLQNQLKNILRPQSFRLLAPAPVYAVETNEAVGVAVPQTLYNSLSSKAEILGQITEAEIESTASGALEEKIRRIVNENSKKTVGSGYKSGNDYVLFTGSDGVVFADLPKGNYSVKISSITGVDISAPTTVEIPFGPVPIINIGVSKGSGQVKAVINKTNVTADKAIFRVYHDGNNNGTREVKEQFLPWAGVKLTLTKLSTERRAQLAEGWTSVAFPLVPKNAKTASGLILETLRQGGYATTVARFENGAWEEFVMRGNTKFGTDFPIEPGRGYMIRNHLETDVIAY
ncbi:hypothetical protein HY085_00375, partial [Candidatus Gottesmanbacteria bacterium]|nr:hypothetical protein [Candidatus Gottesmanbacteria bacterium]